jgi:hypothetical protein
LAELLKFINNHPSADTSRINAFGHGGGIQSAMYLAMRTHKIKNIVNVDGGFFGPRSKSTNSSDYHPEKLTANLLHVVTRSQDAQDNKSLFQALTNPVYKVSIKSENIGHHDFTLFGHIFHSLNKDANAEIARSVVSSVDQTILEFLNGNLKDRDSSILMIHRYN